MSLCTVFIVKTAAAWTPPRSGVGTVRTVSGSAEARTERRSAARRTAMRSVGLLGEVIENSNKLDEADD